MIVPLEGSTGRKTMHKPQSNAERVGEETDLCRVRLVCRALRLTWILLQLVCIILCWCQKTDQTQSESALRVSAQRDVASFSRGSFQSWKRYTVSILF